LIRPPRRRWFFANITIDVGAGEGGLNLPKLPDNLMPMPAPTPHRFNVKEYYRMAETGVLRPDARMELLDGRINDMSPSGPFHGGLVNRLIRIFGKLANGRWQESAQNPLRLDDHSEPEPDFMLLKPATSRAGRPALRPHSRPAAEGAMVIQIEQVEPGANVFTRGA
jgi:hypothetical protein